MSEYIVCINKQEHNVRMIDRKYKILEKVQGVFHLSWTEEVDLTGYSSHYLAIKTDQSEAVVSHMSVCLPINQPTWFVRHKTKAMFNVLAYGHFSLFSVGYSCKYQASNLTLNPIHKLSVFFV